MAETSQESSTSSIESSPPEKSGTTADQAIQRIEDYTHRAAQLARSTAQHVPAAVVVVVGGAVLLAADAFGVGEVVTAGIAGYAAYRLLRRQAKKRAELAAAGKAETAEEEKMGPEQRPSAEAAAAAGGA